MLTRTWLTTLALTTAAAAATFVLAAAQEEPEAPAAVPALERIALIGASVTDGFLLPTEVDAMVTMADVVKAACVQPIDLPFRKSNMLFFRNPADYGTRYVEAALEQEPTLLFAIDFLFWFGYGFILEEEDRLERLETGLALLDRFSCPILVGDFPDMLQAAREGVGIHGAPMISEWQVPRKATLARLNARLREWAGERENVHIVKMADFLERIRSGQSITVHGNTWPEKSLERLLDRDLLHTTFEGTIALTLLALDTLVREDPGFPDTAFRWEPKELKERVLGERREERRQRTAGQR